MKNFHKYALTLLVTASLGLAIAPPSQASEDGHSGGHSDGHTGGEGGKGKGPKYMGGHSSQVHKGGSHHHDGSTGGSKSTEDKIFHGHESDADSHESDTEHSH